MRVSQDDFPWPIRSDDQAQVSGKTLSPSGDVGDLGAAHSTRVIPRALESQLGVVEIPVCAVQR